MILWLKILAGALVAVTVLRIVLAVARKGQRVAEQMRGGDDDAGLR